MSNIKIRKIAISASLFYILVFSAWDVLWKDNSQVHVTGVCFFSVLGPLMASTFVYLSYRRIRGKGKYFWLIVLIAIINVFIGNIIQVYFFYTHRYIDAPFPVLANLFYHISMLFYFTALLHKIYEKRNYYRLIQLFLDAGIVVSIITTISWIYVFKPVLLRTSISILSLTSLTFPFLLMVVLFGIIMLFISCEHALSPRVLLLNVIFATTQLLDTYIEDSLIEDKDNKIKKRINTIKQNCNRLLRLVNNLLDITIIDTGFFEIHLQNLNIVNVVEDITLSVAEYIKSKGITLQFDTDVEEKIMACDLDKIERIILNLLSNAAKFTKHGGSIMVNMHDRGESIIISIKDTGIGIPEDKLKVIFERFRQIDKLLTRNHEGSGIARQTHEIYL